MITGQRGGYGGRRFWDPRVNRSRFTAHVTLSPLFPALPARFSLALSRTLAPASPLPSVTRLVFVPPSYRRSSNVDMRDTQPDARAHSDTFRLPTYETAVVEAVTATAAYETIDERDVCGDVTTRRRV